MKNILAVITIISLILIVGCVSNNSGFAPVNEELNNQDINLVSELQDIEDILNTEDNENEQDTADEEIEETTNTSLDEDEPEIETTGTVDTTGLEQIIVNETDLVNLTINAVDADGDAINYSFTPPLDENGIWQTEYGNAGEYITTITASDGELESSKTVLIVVQKKNVPPKIKGTLSITATEGDEITLDLDITDPNGDNVTVTISKPFNNKLTWDTTHTDNGNYTVTVTASDGELNTTKTVKIIVLDENVPPTISTLEDITIKEGETVNLGIKVADEDKDNLTVTISKPIGSDGIWKTDYNDHGEYTITVKASDGLDTTTKSFMLTVIDVNRAPEIIEIIQG